MISNEILAKVDWNQFEHVARNFTNMCQIVRTHPFECSFWSTKICANHAH